MSESWHGTTSVLNKVEYGYDPSVGFFREVEYMGSVQAMDNLIANMAATGRVVRQTHDGAVKTVTIRFNTWSWDGTEDDYSEVWNHTTDFIEKEIWAAPWVQEAMKSTDDGGFCPSPAEFRKTIEDAVDDGDSFAELLTTFRAKGSDWDFVSSTLTMSDGQEYPAPYALIYRELVRGGTHWQTEANVIRRVRTSGHGYQWNRTLLSTRYIYPTNKILGWPSGLWVYNADSYPLQVEYTKVGWRIRAQEYEVSGDRRSETIELVLAAWSTNFYREYTGNAFYL